MSVRRWRITLLAAAATIAAVYPLTSLFQSSAWFSSAVIMVAVSAGVGLLMRGLTRSRVLVVVVQLLVTGYLVLARFAADTFFVVVPTVASLQAANNYGLEALDTVARYSAPAPLTDGVTFYLVVLVTLIAVAVDAMAATWRSPAVAGLPLLTAYLVTAANGQEPLAVRYFVTSATLWLLMLHTTARAQFGRWSTTNPNPADESGGSSTTDDAGVSVGALSAPLPTKQDASALRAFSTGALKLGLVGVVLALLVPAFIPHFPPRYLTEGLGRGSGDGAGGGSVGFSNTIDLTRSLNNDDQSPVLRYTTTNPSTTPLRVLATGYYSRGEWLSLRDNAASQDQPQPLPPKKSRTDYEIDVTENTLAAPNIAAPYPVVAVAMEGTPWRIDPTTRDVRVSRPVSSYRVTYADVAPLPSKLRESGQPDSPDISADDLTIPDTARGLLKTWSTQVTKGQTNPLDRAVAIQDHLRSSRYRYDLDLGEPLRDDAGRTVEPIRTFYETKRGYCVQFATAMIMLARAQGIPARMAIGFLPGTSEEGSYLVKASDAHAWPELYFQGYGWLRFEPTPGGRSGTPPPYAVKGAGGGAAAGREPSERNTSQATSRAPRPSASATPTPSVPAAQAPSSFDAILTVRSLVIALTVLVLVLAVFVMPITAALVSARRRRRATDRQQVIELEWAELTAHLRDLGLNGRQGATLRQTRDLLVREAHLRPADAESVGQVTSALERSRYDRPERTSPQQAHELGQGIRRIRRDVGRTRATTTRLRAFFWPESGVSIWRSVPARLAGLFSRRH